MFYDDFQTPTLLWTLSPSDANNLRFGPDGLTMLHHRRYTTFTMTEPAVDEYSCLVELDHIPYNFNDIGGIIVIANNKEYAECQSFLATGPSELGNSNLIQADINEMIKALLDDSYVRYTINSQEVVSPSDSTGPTESGNSGSEGEGAESSEKFVDTFYKYIKFTKQKYKYIFWASEDAYHWIEVGNVKFESAGVIGFFLYGTPQQELIDNSHFKVKSIAIYSSRYLTINSISREYDFEITDGDGHILVRTDDLAYTYIINRSSDRCLINTAMFPMPVKNGLLRIYPKRQYDQTLATYSLGDYAYGGDVYTLEQDIEVYIGNEKISPTEVYDLGMFFRGSYHITMFLKNLEEYDVTNLKLTVQAYSEYYGGYEEIMLALPPENYVTEYELDYQKQIIIKRIPVGSSQAVYMRVADEVLDKFYHTANLYRFKITIG